jgi:hypothetical protein
VTSNLSTAVVRCETWYDGTWWEAELPGAWSFSQDCSIKGWPYVFESPEGARLWIHASKHNDISGWDFSIAPSALSHEQKKAFLLAASDSRLADARPVDIARMNRMMLALRQHIGVVTRSSRLRTAAGNLIRVDLGELVGFIYPRQEAEALGWSGTFSHAPWMLRLSFIAPPGVAVEASEVAKGIAASIRFQGPPVEMAP